MLNEVFHKVTSTIMAVLLLLSTVSFTVEKHFCGDHLVDVAIFSPVEKCDMGMASESETPIKKSCCKDEVDVVKGQKDLKLNSFDSLDFSQQFFVTSFVYAYNSLFENLPKQIIPHKDYSPPNLITDIQLLDQVFII